jgi:hypothetical protein
MNVGADRVSNEKDDDEGGNPEPVQTFFKRG